MKIISDKWLHTLIAGTGPAIDLSYIGKWATQLDESKDSW